MNTKTLFLLFFILSVIPAYSYSQYTPKGISYQAVARDEKGFELKSKELEVKISIIASDPSSAAEYSESHSITTDKYGLFTLIIGQGSFVSGTVSEFSEIDWGSGIHFLKVEVDFGYGYRPMGTTQFLSVPYAMYAGTAANAPDANDEQQLGYDPVKKELSLENGGKVDLSGLYEDEDADPLNEIQDLSYSNHTLTISKANSVTINTDDADADPKNEIQNLSLDGYKLNISGGNTVTLTDLFEDADHDSTNEIQDLSYSNHILTLSKANSVTINVDDADADPANEIQDLNFDANSNTLKITKNAAANSIKLDKYLDNKDEQTLYKIGDSLGIVHGNKVLIDDISKTNEIQNLSHPGDSIKLSLNGGVVFDRYEDADSNPGNELQSPKLTGNILTLTNDPASVPIDLNKYLDNTDDQNLSKSGYNLSIENGNSISIRPDIIAFRALKTVETSKLVYAGDSMILVFPTEKMDIMNGYNNLNGKFVVPAGGEGLYHFDLVYQYSTGQSLKIYVNGASYEQVLPVENYPFIIYLNENDSVEILLKSTMVSNPQAGVFSGYRIH